VGSLRRGQVDDSGYHRDLVGREAAELGVDSIRVGDFELYPSERVLSAAGKPVELGARAFDLLLVLVENPGRLVTKATLIERVWPRVIVDENNLPAQIAGLRKVLGADAIRTVPGFGYRLELPVSCCQPADTAAAPATVLAQEILACEGEKPGAGLAWVPLAPIRDVQHVPSAVAGALGLSPDGVDGFIALCQALEQIPALLILDCAEHLTDALATPLTRLISGTQGLRVLITSQVPLGIAGEVVYRLTALPVPEAPEQVPGCAAVRLFVQRAAAADRRFELSSTNTAVVAQICRRLDGIPLALELAAARVPALGLSALLERLDDRFRLLKVAGQAADPRHNALHAAFDWSYSLLSPAEQRVFNMLGAFTGSFSLDTAARCVANETVGMADGIDLIARLVDRSLVTVLAVDPPRYTLLETARHYALERLTAQSELQAARARMAATVLELIDLAYQEYWSLEEATWLNRFGPDLDNVRAATDWALENDPALAVDLFGSAWPLFVERDLYGEGRTRYSQVLALLSDSLPRARVGRFWEAIAAYDSTRQCDRARYAADLAAAMYAATSDVRAQYYALTQIAFSWRVDTAAARSALDAARALEDPTWPARMLTHGATTEGALLMGAGRFPEARAAYQRAVRLALTSSERQALAATVCLVELDIACGNTAAALQLGRPLALSLRHLGRRETRFELLVLIFSALLLCDELDEARSIGAELLELVLRRGRSGAPRPGTRASRWMK
jgi:predicted ATPase/DNA-binding winged helix-turn-helix (wHTH) protein